MVKNPPAGEPGWIPGSGRSAGEGIGYPLQYSWASLVAQLVKNLPTMWETWVRSLGWEDPLEKGKATHFSILAWRISWNVCIVFIHSMCVRPESLQSCPTACDPMDCSPPGSSVHGILQARILEWVAMPSSRGSSRPRDQTCIVRRFTTGASLEAHSFNTLQIFLEHLLCARCCTGHYWTQQGTKSLSPWNAFSSGSTYVVLLKL